jgi:hypothetical protein
MRGVWAAVVLAMLVGEAAAEDLQAGFAAADITPPIGYRMSGYFNERLSTGTLDPLHAKAVVLQQGDVKAAIVICDLIGLQPSITGKARELAQQQTKIPADHICIAATHTHTAPLYAGALREHFHRKAVEKHGRDPQEEIDYPELLANRIAQSIAAADKALQPVALSTGIGEENALSFNRRFHMKDGTVVFNPGRQNPNIIRPAGPIDPDVGLALFRSAKTKEPLGLLTIFALHLDTTGGTKYSADYPYYLEQTLRGRLGDGLHSLFGTGTCGDINHIDVSQPAAANPTKTEAERIGTALGQKVLATLDSLVLQSPQLGVQRGTISVPKQKYSDEEIQRAGLRIDKVGTRDLSFLEQVEATKIMDLQLRPGEMIKLEVQVFRLSSDAAIVCLPGEVFVELGQAIKQSSPFKQTLVMELCNDTPAYIPTRKAFAEGSYETVNSRVVSGSGEKMAELAVQLLKDSKAQK